jgi:hypothetical protein
MSGESFQQRVALLRDSWAERRQLKELAGAHDYVSQLNLLRTLHQWVEAATSDVRAVYGRAVSIMLSPAPVPDGSRTGFTLTIADNHTLSFSLEERRGPGGVRWFVAVKVSSGGAPIAAGPERRNGQWTRSRLEDILLSVLGAYERSVSEGARGGLTGGLRARGA